MLALVQWLQMDAKYLGQVTSKLKLIGQEDQTGISQVAKDIGTLLEMETNKTMWGKHPDDDEDDESQSRFRLYTVI